MASCTGYIVAALAFLLPPVSESPPQGKPGAKNAWARPAPLSADRFLRQIYAHYSSLEATGAAALESPWQRAASLFTPRTIAVIDAHRKLLTEVSAVDGDPFCDCQDWIAITVDRVSTRTTGPNQAQATVNFHDRNGASKQVAFRLQRYGDEWRVDDMTLLGASPDGWLVSILEAETAALRAKTVGKEP
jgi:hypothetical protein